MARASFLLRAAGFLALWLVLAGWQPADLPAAAVAVIAATWVSLKLSPAAVPGLSLPNLAVLTLRYPLQSLLAGIDVARRAFAPSLPLHVDTIAYTPLLPPGPARDAFLAYASTMPGTVPVTADVVDTILMHCLDSRHPVAAQMAAEERRFMRVLGEADA